MFSFCRPLNVLWFNETRSDGCFEFFIFWIVVFLFWVVVKLQVKKDQFSLCLVVARWSSRFLCTCTRFVFFFSFPFLSLSFVRLQCFHSPLSFHSLLFYWLSNCRFSISQNEIVSYFWPILSLLSRFLFISFKSLFRLHVIVLKIIRRNVFSFHSVVTSEMIFLFHFLVTLFSCEIQFHLDKQHFW